MTWMSAKTPPNKPGPYLVAIDCPRGWWVEINVFHIQDGWENDAGYDIVDTNAYVRYWMELPELPKKMAEGD